MGNNNQNNYIYIPSLAGASVTCAIYGILTVLLALQAVRHRVRYTTIITIAAACECVGFLFRSLSASGNRLDSFALFLVMDMFVILSPLAFMAGLYVVYGRLVRRLYIATDAITTTSGPGTRGSRDSIAGEQGVRAGKPAFSLIPPHLYTRIFVSCDITSFLIQAAGAGLIVSSTPTTAKLGKDILMAGLAFGLVSFLTFTFLTLQMLLTARRAITRGVFRVSGMKEGGWWKVMVPILVGEVCILVRTVYRLVEFAGGYSGHIYTTEWFLYVFDVVFMVVTAAIWIPFFPAKYGLDQSIPGSGDVAGSAEDGGVVRSTAEEKGAGTAEEKGVVLTNDVSPVASIPEERGLGPVVV